MKDLSSQLVVLLVVVLEEAFQPMLAPHVLHFPLRMHYDIVWTEVRSVIVDEADQLVVLERSTEKTLCDEMMLESPASNCFDTDVTILIDMFSA